MRLPERVGLGDALRHRVIRQLLEALLFEGVIRYSAVPTQQTGWQWLHFSLGELEARCRGRVRGFGRVSLAVESLGLTRRGKRVAVDLESLIGHLPAPLERREALLEELEATLQHARECRRLPDRRDLDTEALDSALHEGHPYHPCFKTRLGFRGDDPVRFGPESGHSFRLHWLAVPRDRLVARLPEVEWSFWDRELGATTARALRAALHDSGTDTCHHHLMPVHPWQWRQLSEGPLGPALARGEIISLGAFGDVYRSSQSLRSLFNASRPGQACVKLSLGISNTSSRRHLDPHSVPSAPSISRWLNRTVDADPRFAQHYPLRLLDEYAGLLVTGHPERPTEQSALAGELGAIWRRGIATRLVEGERAVPCNALFAVEADGRPFIHPWIERYGVGAWLDALLHTLVLPVWHLLVAHGIAVEAHAQNALLVVRDGWPVALLLRDFHDSVEYVESFLPEAAERPDFDERQALYDAAPADRYYRMGRVEALRELVMDTLFVFHLSELALAMETHYRLHETHFWQRVGGCLETHARHHPELAPRLARLGHHRPWIATESLLTRKLRGPDAPECHHRIPNPLADGDFSDNPDDSRG